MYESHCWSAVIVIYNNMIIISYTHYNPNLKRWLIFLNKLLFNKSL